MLERPKYFSIKGFEKYYSKQEQKLLTDLIMKLHVPNEETIDREKYMNMKKDKHIYDEKAYLHAMKNTKYNDEGKAVVAVDDEWREEKEWDAIFAQACNVLSYKNYRGTVEYSEEDKCFFSKVMGIRSLILCEGDTVEELEKDFKESIDVYLEECKKDGVEPEQPIYGNNDYVLDIPNAETLKAFKEVEEMKKNSSRYKSYASVDEMMADLLKEDGTED